MGSRQFKEGIDFFYFDTDFFTNDKMQLIEAEFGVKGTIVALRLLCKIYSDKGYYYQWGGDECLLFSKMAGAEFVPNAVKEIVDGLVRRRFFDKGCFDRFAILTSKSIQEIYIQATERRKNITLIKEYLLLDFDKKPSNVNILPLNVNIIPQNEDKKRQSKVKESKVEKSNTLSPSGDILSPSSKIIFTSETGEKEKSSAKKEKEFVDKVIAYFNETCKNLKPVQVTTEKRTASILARCREHGKEKIMTMIDNASKSAFLSGQNDRGWTATFDWLFKLENFVKTFEGNFNNQQNGKSKSTNSIDDEELRRATAEGIARACTKQEWER